MAKTFRYQHLRSTTSGSKPSTSVIREGEIAVNLADEKMFLKNTSGQIVDFISEKQVDAKIASQSGASQGEIDALSGAIDSLDSKLDTELAKKANTATTYSKTEVDAALAGKADSATTYTKTEVDATISNNIKDFFDGAEYDSATTRINFKHGSTVKAYIDASAFIKDGMVSNVEIKTVQGLTCLVITFNEDSGKQAINIPISDIFDASNYYTTAQTEAYVSGYTYDKATIDQKISDSGTFDPTQYYDKTATDNLLAAKADTATTYTKTEVNTALAGKADTATTYTKTEVNTALAGKADSATTLAGYGITNAYTKTEVDTALSEKQATLVSGTNIKTVVNKTLLGSGNVEISLTELSTGGVSDLTVDGDTIILDAGTF